MQAEDVANYLKGHPDFFEAYADLLAQIYVPHPHGGRAIPLAERQVVSLREKARALEAKLSELIQFGEENDAIGDKVHRLGVALLAASAREPYIQALYGGLREDFAVPHVAMRLWRGEGEGAEHAPVSDELRDYAAQLAHPFCGANANFEAVGWFGEAAPHVRSVAFMPLRDADGTFGMLAIGSEDPERFFPEMGTLYLQRIADLAGAGLARFG
ncbi:MAG: DUF484 family protein [Burkholderiales bacterium]|jgi:hypothetical protein|nr:DUF484 family protein [Burkholderiales bacterium]